VRNLYELIYYNKIHEINKYELYYNEKKIKHYLIYYFSAMILKQGLLVETVYKIILFLSRYNLANRCAI